MLRIVGINADLVLVPRFAQAFPATPGLAFNHAISRVKLDGKIVWVDTTDDVCRFGLLPPGDSGRNVLVIHPDIRELTSLPQGQPGDHRLTILQEIDLTAPNPAVKIQASASGYFDYAFRAATREVTASRPAFPILGEMLRSRVADLRMIHQEFTGVAELNKPFEWQATASYPQLLQPLPDGKEQILHAPFHQPNEWSLAIQRRSHPLFLNQGYPGKIEERILFQLPTGMAEVELPQSEKGSDGLFSWSISWSQTQGKVEARSQVEWLRGELSVSETVTFQREMERLQAAAALPAVMQKGR